MIKRNSTGGRETEPELLKSIFEIQFVYNNYKLLKNIRKCS